MPHIVSRPRRTAASVLAAFAVAALVSGCAATEYPAIDSTVTFKTIESPRIEESCGGFPLMCSNNDIPTKYLVEITYPDDPDLFKTDSYSYEYYVGRECWISVKPDVYAALNLGDTVKLGHPGTDSSMSSQDLPSACDIAEDIGNYVAEEEYAPGDSEYTGVKPGDKKPATDSPDTGPDNRTDADSGAAAETGTQPAG